MNHNRRASFLIIVLFFLTFHPALAEKLSLKFSYKQNSISDGDINTWIKSINSLWVDWKNKKGGQLEGEFLPISYGSNFEVEIRIPIISGFALNLSGSRLQDKKEGNTAYENEGATQAEDHFITNEVSAWPFKIGFSISFPLPFLTNLYVFTSAGRHIIFVRYKSMEKYEAIFKIQDKEFSYWYERENTYNSEALGYYAAFGFEYDLIKNISFVAEAVKIWSKVDGFKGPYTYKNSGAQPESGKASLYYYESNQWDMDQYYSVLAGHKNKPEGSNERNIRQGELNFSGFSLNIGIKFKF